MAEREEMFPHDDALERLPAPQREAEMAKKLHKLIAYAYENAPGFKKRMDGAGVKPKDIRTLKDLQKLPFTTSKDLQEGYPFPLLSVPFEKVVRIHASSGTTGKRKVLPVLKASF